MAIPNTFSNGTVADADEVNANFTYVTNLLASTINDVSANADFTPSVSGNLAAPTAGTEANAYDKDFSTEYTVSSASTGGGAKTLTVLCDYGAIYSHIHLTYKIDFITNNITGHTFKLEHSTDNSNWTELENEGVGNETIQVEDSVLMPQLRYLRMTGTGSGDPVTLQINTYEFIVSGVE